MEAFSENELSRLQESRQDWSILSAAPRKDCDGLARRIKI